MHCVRPSQQAASTFWAVALQTVACSSFEALGQERNPIVNLSQNADQKLLQVVRVAHSPDADDRFMFWPLREGLVGHPSFSFVFSEADTQTLNQLSETQQPEICAISAMHYGRVAQTYQPLRMGCSVGNNYGPVVVVKSGRAEDLSSGKLNLLTPGPKTTAHAILHLLGHTFAQFETVPIVPIERVFEKLDACEAAGVATAALLIHEGRLIFQNYGCRKVLDIGEAWKQKTGGSLPLGMNVVARHLPEPTRAALSALCIQSCTYAQDHLEDYVALAAKEGSPYYSPLSASELRAYLALYANETTRDVSSADQQSFETLMREGVAQGFNPAQDRPCLDWI